MKRVRRDEAVLGTVFTPRMYWFDKKIRKGEHLVLVARENDVLTFLHVETGTTYARRYMEDENLCVLLKVT